jgi:hypothetical protein
METDAETPDPAAALDLVAAARSGLADRLVTPWWYHPVLGLLVGGLIAAQALPSTLLRSLALVLYGLGLVLLVNAYRRLTGLWVNGLRPGPAQRWSIGLGVTIGVLLVVALGVRAAGGWAGAPLVAGLLAVPLVMLVGHKYDRVLRADLRTSA